MKSLLDNGLRRNGKNCFSLNEKQNGKNSQGWKKPFHKSKTLVMTIKNRVTCELVEICMAAIIIAVLCTTCSNSNSSNSEVLKPSNWVTLNVRFQPNTDEEHRDRSIKAIQRMLLHSVAPLMNQYTNYYPSMRVTTTPFGDTLHYWVTVMNTYGQGTNPMAVSTAKTIDPPTCPQCPTTNPCRICDSLFNYSQTGNPYAISAISIDTTSLILK